LFGKSCLNKKLARSFVFLIFATSIIFGEISIPTRLENFLGNLRSTALSTTPSAQPISKIVASSGKLLSTFSSKFKNISSLFLNKN